MPVIRLVQKPVLIQSCDGKAVINIVKRVKPKKIIVAEASAIGADTMRSLEVSGIKKAAEEAGADAIIDIKQEKTITYLSGCPIRHKPYILPRFW
jgi:uncharacterized protein (DUF362 family)